MLDKQPKYLKYTIIAVCLPPSLIFLREIWWYFYRKYHSLPPGPNGVPILGFFNQWNSGTTARINLGKKYGSILYSHAIRPPQSCTFLSCSVFSAKLYSMS